MAAASNAALHQDVKTLQSEAEKLQKELESVLVQFHEVQQEAELIEHEVVDEVSSDVCFTYGVSDADVSFCLNECLMLLVKGHFCV